MYDYCVRRDTYLAHSSWLQTSWLCVSPFPAVDHHARCCGVVWYGKVECVLILTPSVCHQCCVCTLVCVGNGSSWEMFFFWLSNPIHFPLPLPHPFPFHSSLSPLPSWSMSWITDLESVGRYIEDHERKAGLNWIELNCLCSQLSSGVFFASHHLLAILTDQKKN